MNCAQHTETAAVAYCCTCGKPLCESCKHEVQGTIFCEPCLAARIQQTGGFGANFRANLGKTGTAAPNAPESASPGLALFLGFIPGVGAFYNGQFLKGFVHVMVFATLIWLSDNGMETFGGLMIAAWLFYMVFDAWSTAKARRYGLPIPDPLGLNHILEGREGTFRERVEQVGERFGTHVEAAAHNIGQQWQKAGGAAGSANQGGTAGNPPTGAAASAGQSSASGAQTPGANQFTNPNANPAGSANAAPGSAYVGPQGTYYAGPEGTYYAPPKERDRSPVGAVVLIGCGVLLLLANLGWFSFHWIEHFWPVILITIGLWLFAKRQHDGRVRNRR